MLDLHLVLGAEYGQFAISVEQRQIEYVTLNTILSGAFCAIINLALRGVHNLHKIICSYIGFNPQMLQKNINFWMEGCNRLGRLASSL